MTSSGTYNYSLSVGESVLAAYERVRVRGPSIRPEHMTTARREVNLLLAEWSNNQVNMWKVEQNSFPLVAGTATYSIPTRTVMVLDAWITTGVPSTSQSTDRYVTPMSRTEYASLANKLTQGAPTTYWFDRLLAPTLTFYPVPDSVNSYTFNYFSCVQVQDANIPNGETPDIPYLWLDAFVAGLAYRLSRAYAPELEQIRKMDASDAWKVAATQNTEQTPFYVVPNIGGYYRR